MQRTNEIITVKQLFVLLLFAFTSSQVIAQKEDYNYPNYRFPEVTVRGLDVGINLLGSSQNVTSFFGDQFGLSAFFGQVNPLFFQFVNKSNIQKTDNITLPITFETQKSDNRSQSSSTGFSIYARKDQIRRKYTDDLMRGSGFRGKFWELNHGIQFDHQRTRRTDNNFDTKTYSTSLDVIAQLRAGVGRIEPMSEVFMAQFIMDDLLETGLITESWTESQLFNFAAVIAAIQNVRVFDSRRRNIFRLQSINQWLAQQGVPQNISSFAILNDNLLFNLSNQRLEGKRFSYGIQPWMRTNWSTFSSESKTAGGIGLNAEYLKIKNHNQNFQSEFNAALGHDLFFSDFIGDEPHISSVNTRYGAYYNPNSRTTYGVSIGLDYYTAKFERHALVGSARATVNYFISNMTRIQFDLSLNSVSNTDGVRFEKIDIDEFNQNFRQNNSRNGTSFSESLARGNETYLRGNLRFIHSFF